MSLFEDFSSKNLRYNSYRTDEIGMSNDRIFIVEKIFLTILLSH